MKKVTAPAGYLYAIIAVFLITVGLVLLFKSGGYGKAVTIGPSPTPDYSEWEDAHKKGIMPDPGYGLPPIESGPSIINPYPDEQPKAVIYNPPSQDYPKLTLPGYGQPAETPVPSPTPQPTPITQPQPAKPTGPSLEEQGRIRTSGKYTCYYDEKGNFVRAWRTYGSGSTVIYEGEGSRPTDCPARVKVSKTGTPVVSK